MGTVGDLIAMVGHTRVAERFYLTGMRFRLLNDPVVKKPEPRELLLLSSVQRLVT